MWPSPSRKPPRPHVRQAGHWLRAPARPANDPIRTVAWGFACLEPPPRLPSQRYHQECLGSYSPGLQSGRIAPPGARPATRFVLLPQASTANGSKYNALGAQRFVKPYRIFASGAGGRIRQATAEAEARAGSWKLGAGMERRRTRERAKRVERPRVGWGPDSRG